MNFKKECSASENQNFVCQTMDVNFEKQNHRFFPKNLMWWFLAVNAGR
jgi:hypothetical protein